MIGACVNLVRVLLHSCKPSVKVRLWQVQAWTLSNGVGNPASLYPNEMRLLFDAAFKGDYNVRKSILGFEHSFLQARTQATNCALLNRHRSSYKAGRRPDGPRFWLI